jgi:hypothetical protein
MVSVKPTCYDKFVVVDTVCINWASTSLAMLNPANESGKNIIHLFAAP